MGDFIKRFFDKTRGKEVPLEHFPSLFAMEGHTGGFGMAFAGLWFLLASRYIDSLWKDGGELLVYFAIGIIGSFFSLLWLSFYLGQRYADRINELNRSDPQNDRAKVEFNVRIWIAVLSAFYVLVCCVLIWLTGGALSPFTPFFVMIFTLTISRNNVPHPGAWALAYFLIAIIAACVAHEYWRPPIDGLVMSQIKQSGFNSFMHAIFICASLIVPAISEYAAAKSRLKMQKRGGG